jgi:hypothetical protein
MNAALKEWAAVISALAAGRQMALLRKGGIVEADRGGFRVLYREFLLFPTFEHQHEQLLKPENRHLAEPQPEDQIKLTLMAAVTDIIPAPPSPDVLFRSAADCLIWNRRFFESRYAYRPDLPLYLLLLRAKRLPEARIIPARPSYTGCKSWVNLTEEIDVADSMPVLPEESYLQARESLLKALG